MVYKNVFYRRNKKIKEDCSNKIAIFVDMDGVIADYRFGEGENIEKKCSRNLFE